MKIVFCIDKNYEKMAQISIDSYKKNNPGAEIIVVSEEKMPLSLGYHRNIIMKLDRKFRNRGEGDRISNMAYMKIFLTELPYQTILYVDADTICQKPLNELMNIPCEYINLTESHIYGEQQAKAIGNERYGLTGMMVMNLDNLRKINFTERCLKVEREYPTPVTGWQHDETCINVAMGDNLQFVDKKFNYCHNRMYENPIPEQDAYILHYVGAKGKQEMLSRSAYIEISDIKDSINGNTVAIVGNAQSLFERTYGEDIDDHGFIVRFNKGFITRPECQGTRTNFLILACPMSKKDIDSFGAEFVANRSASSSYGNKVPYTIGSMERQNMKNFLDAQPSTGFMAIDICLYFGAKSIDLYGFDWEETPTFYNPKEYKTKHNYSKEREILEQYEKNGIIKINR